LEQGKPWLCFHPQLCVSLTICRSSVTKELISNQEDGTGLAFFFAGLQVTPEHVLGSLCRQLLTQLPSATVRLFFGPDLSQTRSHDERRMLLSQINRLFKNVYVVVDGIRTSAGSCSAGI
jgi:hypothetical protein